MHLVEDVQNILHTKSLCGKSPVQDEKITASNIMGWREEQAKKFAALMKAKIVIRGILKGPQIEEIFLIECETLMLEMSESIRKLQLMDEREPEISEVLQILEKLALRYEPTVEKLKKRYSEESSVSFDKTKRIF